MLEARLELLSKTNMVQGWVDVIVCWGWVWVWETVMSGSVGW